MPWLLLKGIFGDWKVILLIVIALGAAFVALKLHKLESNLKSAQEQVKVEQANNAVLRTNVDTLTKVNIDNQRVLEQHSLDTKTNLETIGRLSSDLKSTAKSFSTRQQKIDSMTVPATPLSPYIREAIDGIQEERDKLNPPVVVIQPTITPKPASKQPIVPMKRETR